MSAQFLTLTGLQPAFDYLRQAWPDLLAPAAVFLITLSAGLIGKRMLFRVLRRWAERTHSDLDDLLLSSVEGSVSLWVLILAAMLAASTAPVSPRIAGLISKVLLVLWIVSITVVAARLSGSLTRRFGSSFHGNLPVTTLTQSLVSLAVSITGALILLNTLGISITPILTALGVGGLAVALALQDTLSNLFAGFYVSLAGQIRVGDYIRLDSGEEGFVADIGWRSTTIRALANNLILIPNAKLAQAIVTNYDFPEKRMSLLIPVSVSYECDPDHVEAVLTEEALKGAAHIPGLLSEPAPFVRFISGFGAYSLDFTLICQVSQFVDQYLVQHELRKRILRRFRQEGIEIPYPVRTVVMQDRTTGRT